MSNNKICNACYSQEGTKKLMRGSFFIELILWLCFLVPGVIYTIWRYTTIAHVCKSCESTDVIPTNSPRGQQIINQITTTKLEPAKSA